MEKYKTDCGCGGGDSSGRARSLLPILPNEFLRLPLGPRVGNWGAGERVEEGLVAEAVGDEESDDVPLGGVVFGRSLEFLVQEGHWRGAFGAGLVVPELGEVGAGAVALAAM